MFSFFNNDDIIWIGNGTNFTDKEIQNKTIQSLDSYLHVFRSLVRPLSRPMVTVTDVPSQMEPL